jgi:hypothetical protein
MRNMLQKLMLWRKGDDAQSANPLPDSGSSEESQPRKLSDPIPYDPLEIQGPETAQEKEYREERQRELLAEHERRGEEGEPPDYQL